MGEHDDWGRQDPYNPQYPPLDQRLAAPGTPAGPVGSAEGQTSRAAEPPTVGLPAAPPPGVGSDPNAGPSGGPTVGPAYAAPPPAGHTYEGPQHSAPTSGYPAGPYQPGSYPAVGYPGAGTQPVSGYPPAGGYPPGTAGPAGHPSSGGGRIVRIGAIVIGAVLLALCSGVLGGLAVHSAERPGAIQTVTRAAAPEVDRSSVAGVAEAILPSVVDINTGEGEGSGVILSADGAIITNNHVVAGASGGTVDVTFSDGKSAKATIVGTDPIGDIAVIKAQGVTGLTAAKFGDSSAARVGDTVLAIGSPLGLQGSVSAGIVSALHRTIDEASSGTGGGHSIGDAIQTDAAINPGNSGGALINLAGEVIGINTAIATSGGQGEGNIGVGFAISGNKAKSAAEQLLKGGKVSHPYLGVRLSDGPGGALIADVVADGPAAKAGLQKGDIVTKAGSQVIKDASGMVAAVQTGKSGDPLALTIKRGTAEQQVTVTLGDTP